MTQGKTSDHEKSLNNSEQGSDEGVDVKRYTYPLPPDRKGKIAAAFQRRVNTELPKDPNKTDGW